MFEEIKKEILEIIKSSEEIKNNTSNKNVGIYLIYIDNFNDNKILPIYIGQTDRSFQSRYKEHLKEIMALNRLHYCYYKKLLLDMFFERKYKTCKIFKYMVDHNCTLKDFHMVVLEKVDKGLVNLNEILNKKEQEYFSKYLPAFFGFNQTNTFSGIIQNIELSKLLECLLKDSENFIKYFGYGYTKFNYYYSFPKEINDLENVDKNLLTMIKNNLKIIKDNYYDENRFKKYKDQIPILRSQIQELRKKKNEYYDNIENEYFPKIRKYCEDNKIGFNQKFKDIERLLLTKEENLVISKEKQIKNLKEQAEKNGIYYNDSMINDFDFSDYDTSALFKKYLKRKNIGANIVDILNKDSTFVDLRNKYCDYKKLLEETNDKLNEYLYIDKIDTLKRLLPENEYISLPLKDNCYKINLGDVQDDSIIINFEFSHHGKLNSIMYPCNLIRIDYKLIINGIVEEKNNIYIKTEKDNSYEGNIYYAADYKQPKIYKDPFNIISYNNYISPAMEVLNGINDYTLIGKEKFDFNIVLDEINLKINETTKVIVRCQKNMKNVCKNFIYKKYNKENLLSKKIIEFLN